MKVIVCFVVVVLAAAVSGCDTVGCDFRDGSLNGPEDRCQDRSGFQSIGFKEACGASGGEAVEGGCPVEGVVFGCDLGQGVTDWYYDPTSPDDDESECGSDPIVDAP